MATTPSIFGRIVVARATANDPWGVLYKEVLFNGSGAGIEQTFSYDPRDKSGMLLKHKESGEFYTRDVAVDYLASLASGSQEAKDLSNFYKIKDEWQKMRAFEAKLNEVKKENPNYKLPDAYQKMYEEQKDKLVQKRLSQNSVSPYEPQGEQVIIDKDALYSRARAGAASNRKKRATTILTGGSDSSLGLGSKSVGKVTLLGI